MPKAIFFDLDDTLIFYEQSYETAWKSIISARAERLGKTAPQEIYQTIRACSSWYWNDLERHRTGRLDLRKARRDVVRLAFERLGRDNYALADDIADAYSDERETGFYLIPGALEVLTALRERGIKLALITNGAGEVQRAKIDRYNLAPYFDNILIEGEFGTGKPDERVFRYTMEKLDVKPAGAWMVGDDLRFDIAPCRALGIYSLLVQGYSDNPYSLDGVKPDKEIRSVAEIPDLL